MKKPAWNEKIQGIVFKLLLIAFAALAAWQSQIHFISFDWTKNQRNSLSNNSTRLIQNIDTPLHFTLFVSPNFANSSILNNLLKRYQYHQPLISITLLNPDLSPELLRQHDIRQDGTLIIEYKQKTEKVTALSERNISNAIQRLLRQQERWIVFLEGHGERHPYGDANHDLSTFAAQLATKGFIIESLNLSKIPNIPDNTQVLVIASPKNNFLAGETDIITRYIARGGNLLWLAEPNENSDLDALAEALNIDFLNGIIVDPNSQLLGLDRVDYTLINEYPVHPVTEYITAISIFPQATALFDRAKDSKQKVWDTQPLLLTQANTWTETGPLQGKIIFGDNSDESAGPLNLSLSLSRTLERDNTEKQQRIIVIGDGDFLANQFLGNGANAELGYNIINWLSHDDELIAINAKAAPDTELDLTDNEKIILAFGFLIVLPLAFLLFGLRIWLTRKNR